MLSVKSSTPPIPGIITPESLHPVILFKTDSARSPIKETKESKKKKLWQISMMHPVSNK